MRHPSQKMSVLKKILKRQTEDGSLAARASKDLKNAKLRRLVMKSKEKSNDQEESTGLPDIAMIIIKEQGKSYSDVRMLNLDNYEDGMRKKYYMDAISKY